EAAAPAAPPPAAPATPTTPSVAPAAPASTTEAPSTPPSAATPAPSDVPAGQPTIGRSLLPQDMSPWGMFMNADLVVKAVIIGLAFASLVTWTVYVAKMIELRAARRDVRAGLRILANAATLAQ